jgi:hypothetical protein
MNNGVSNGLSLHMFQIIRGPIEVCGTGSMQMDIIEADQMILETI